MHKSVLHEFKLKGQFLSAMLNSGYMEDKDCPFYFAEINSQGVRCQPGYRNGETAVRAADSILEEFRLLQLVQLYYLSADYSSGQHFQELAPFLFGLPVLQVLFALIWLGQPN